MGCSQLSVCVGSVLLGSVVLMGCGEEKQTKVERLSERVSLLESELSSAQRQSGQINQELGSLKSRNRELINKSNQDRSELVTARNRLVRAEELKNDALRRQESAAQFLQQREELYEQIEDLRDKVVETSELRRQAVAREGMFDKSAAEYESVVKSLNAEVLDLIEQVNEMSESVTTSSRLQEELDLANNLIAELAADHPQFFVSLLEKHKELNDLDLLTWKSISLELVSSRFTLGQVLRMKMPLEMADNRGTAVLFFGSIEVAALRCDVDLVERIVTYTFPNAAEVRSVMKINTSDILRVMFGPAEFRSEFVFEAGVPVTGLGGTRIDFQVKSVKLSGLSIAERSEHGVWRLEK